MNEGKLMYKKYSVEFILDEKENEMLVNLFTEWKNYYQNSDDTIEKFFEFIMTAGSKYTIESRLENFKTMLENQEQKGERE